MAKTIRRATMGLLLTVMSALPLQAEEPHAEIKIHADTPGPVYSREIFSQFAEHLGHGIYGGLWVGDDKTIPNTDGFRNDVIAALKELQVPVVRWPGGCFADEYHWREGIGPKADRPTKVNTHWGGVTEPNTVGTHEFMDLVRLLGAEPYISGNVGNGSPREMAEWVEYMTSPAGSLADERAANGHPAPWALPYFGLGNELWGCGGHMRAEYAADVTRRYATFIKAPAGTQVLKIASGANTDDLEWTETMMKSASEQIDALSLHYYTVPGGWPPSASASDFGEDAWAQTLAATLRMEQLLADHTAIMDKYDPEKRIWLAVDEWGTWYAGDPGTNPGFLRQQNTLRDALVAAINFNIFSQYADRVKMTAIAQMVNVLQAMILTEGSQMVRTPTFHVFEMYKPFQDGTVLPLDIQSPEYTSGEWTMPAISAAAVRGKDGRVHVALANLNPNEEIEISAHLDGADANSVSGRVLTADKVNALNTFDTPDAVAPRPFAGSRLKDGTLTVTMPPKSVVMLELD